MPYPCRNCWNSEELQHGPLSLFRITGKLNSVTIIDNSLHMAKDVEFGNFLTRMYLENISVTMRKSILFQ